MIGLIIRQANWGILGSIFGAIVGFFIKIYLIDIVGLTQWGKYASFSAFSTLMSTILSLGIPWLIVKYIPHFIEIDKDKANQIIRKCFVYSLVLSISFICLIFSFSSIIDQYIYVKINNFSDFLLLSAFQVPIAIFTGLIIALYRSIFKIKEIVLYGTLVIVPIRAILTFFVFTYFNNVLYFIYIEIFTSLLSLVILLLLYNKNNLSLFIKRDPNFVFDTSIKRYSLNMYANSVITFFSAQFFTLILSILLPPIYTGVYSVLLTISGVVLLLINNLNTVFTPAISKLFKANNIDELSELYKKTTFIVNLIAFPILILFVFFTKPILFLYDSTGHLYTYKYFFYIIILARLFRLSVGSAGSMLVMTGLEKYELKMQIVRGFSMIFISAVLYLVFLDEKNTICNFSYENFFIGIVIVFMLFSLLTEFYRVISLYNKLSIHPYSKYTIRLILLSIPLFYISVIHDFDFAILDYIFIPIFILLLYFSLFYKKIKSIYKEILISD